MEEMLQITQALGPRWMAALHCKSPCLRQSLAYWFELRRCSFEWPKPADGNPHRHKSTKSLLGSSAGVASLPHGPSEALCSAVLAEAPAKIRPGGSQGSRKLPKILFKAAGKNIRKLVFYGFRRISVLAKFLM